jgi:hypothetical protein
MPVPRFCFFVPRVAANFQPFVDNEARALHLPTAYMPVLCEKQSAPVTVEISDGSITPFSFINTHNDPTYLDESFYGQYYSVQGDKLWFGIWKWEGTMCEHQIQGAGCSLRNHELLYGDLDVERNCSQIYMQMFTKPSTPCIETFYEPWVAGDVL